MASKHWSAGLCRQSSHHIGCTALHMWGNPLIHFSRVTACHPLCTHSPLCSGQSSWPQAFEEEAAPQIVPHTSAEGVVQPGQGWAPQAQGQIMSHHQIPGMSPHLHPTSSPHLLQYYPAQIHNLPQDAVSHQQQQQQQGAQVATGAANPETQLPATGSVSSNIPSFFQSHTGPPVSSKQGLFHPAMGPLLPTSVPGLPSGQAPFAQPVVYGHTPVALASGVDGNAAATGSLPAVISAPLLLLTAVSHLDPVSAAVRPMPSDATTAAGTQAPGTASQSAAVPPAGIQVCAPMQSGNEVLPQFGTAVHQQPGVMPDYQTGFGYLLAAPQLPHGSVVYQPMPANVTTSGHLPGNAAVQPAPPQATTQAGVYWYDWSQL